RDHVLAIVVHVFGADARFGEVASRVGSRAAAIHAAGWYQHASGDFLVGASAMIRRHPRDGTAAGRTTAAAARVAGGRGGIVGRAAESPDERPAKSQGKRRV